MVEKDSTGGQQLPTGETLQNSTPDDAIGGESGGCPVPPEVLPLHVRVIWFELKLIAVLDILILLCWKRYAGIVRAIHSRSSDARHDTS